mmetsp:Transcript_11153/g.17916  ORF Transcript_11153/g.17916 Transcript_11153/m.17916 type:complete len:515 (-) Transcript_11153:107-1651(-)
MTVSPTFSPSRHDNSDDDNQQQQSPLPCNLEKEAPLPKLYGQITVTENEWGTRSVWDDYQKEELLMDDGIGEIWSCRIRNDNHDTGRGSKITDQMYAIKSIDKNFLSGMFAKELRNEIDVLRQLDHPNIVRIYETYENRDTIFLVMEYCSGGDLTSKFPYSEAQVARIMKQVLSAVVYCHQHKVVHRDLKLENILWATDEQVKLIDFGYAQSYRQPRREYKMKMDVGTTYTLSPQIVSGQKYTERTDEWGLGVIAYILLTGGTKPFDAEKDRKIREEIKQGEYSIDGPEWEGISKEAKEFVRQLLEYDQEKRISAEEALQSPWIQAYARSEEDKVDEEVMHIVEKAILYSIEEPRLKRLSKMIIAHDAPEERISKLRQAFVALDTSKDGTITLVEFQSVMKASSNLSENELREVFSELDLDQTGIISYTDFLSATIESIGLLDEDAIALAFDKLADESGGVIEKENIQAVLEKSTKDAESEAAAILEEANADKEGTIDFETFSGLFADDQAEIP